MAMHGPCLRDCHMPAMEFGAVVYLTQERINAFFAEYSDVPLDELPLLGTVVALRALVKAEPMLASAMISHDDVAEWDRQTCRWFEAHGKKLKVKRGVSRDAILAEIRKELRRITTALNRGLYRSE